MYIIRFFLWLFSLIADITNEFIEKNDLNILRWDKNQNVDANSTAKPVIRIGRGDQDQGRPVSGRRVRGAGTSGLSPAN